MSIYIDDSHQFKKQYEENLDELNKCLMFQNQKSLTINDFLDNLQSLYNTNKDNTNNEHLIQVLKDLKDISLQIRNNKYAINAAIKDLQNISNDYNNNVNAESFTKKIFHYNTNLIDLKMNINTETSRYNKFIVDYINNRFSVEKIFLIDKANETINDNDTLLISLKNGKVFLPYLVKDLKDKINTDNKDEIQDLINKEYILPLSKYKNPTMSRFVEGYVLMKKKENAPFLESIDLGFEMAFNKSLDPAIITACKNLDELDNYLDFLENKDTKNFKLFKIKYELLPKKTNKKEA